MPLQKLKPNVCKTVALTSDVTSPITEVVDEVLDLKIGLETVGFVTKGYTATLLNLFLFGLKLGYQKHQLTKVEVEEELAKLTKAIQEIDSVIYKTEQFWQKRKRINRGDTIYRNWLWAQYWYGERV